MNASNKNLFTQKKLDTKNANITSVNISGKNLITGDDKGNLIIYELRKDKLNLVNELKVNSKIEKICIPKKRKIAFILSGGDIFFMNLPKGENLRALFNSKDIANIYLNFEESKYENMFMILYNNLKLKVYEYDIDDDTPVIKEFKMKKELSIEKLPDCACWTLQNYFVYSVDNKFCYWLNCDTGVYKSKDEFMETVDMIDVSGRLAVSNINYTIFMEEGSSSNISCLPHPNADFHCYCLFKNNLIALYDNNITIYKEEPGRYDIVETINFNSGEKGKFLIASRFKLIVLTSSGNNINIIDFQEKPLEEQIKVFIDKKLYIKGMELLVENIPEEDDERIIKMENVFLDCGWACLEGPKKDYNNAIKYLGISNFNPFEFIYMFYEALNIKIFHQDKENDIKNSENQFIKKNVTPLEQKQAFEFLINILKIKREYIIEYLIKMKSYTENSDIKFMSSNRSKINLKDSQADISIGDTFYAINTTIIKCMIKLMLDPKKIEDVFDDETLNYTNLEGFSEDPFLADEKIKILEQTKFTLCYISEKSGKNYEQALKQWKVFGEDKNQKYSLIGKDRTKKLFYKLKEERSIDIETKERLFKEYIIWILKKYPEDAFEVIKKTEQISTKIFMDEIIPKIESKEDLKEKYLEYCNNNQTNEIYQTLLLKLYADKLFALTGKDKKPKKIEGNIKKYYDLFNEVIKSYENVYNKKDILKYIENSWLKEQRIYLYSQLKENTKALNELFNDANDTASLKKVEEYCKNNNDIPKEKIFEKFYHLLSIKVKEFQSKIIQNKEKLEKFKTNSNEKNDDTKTNLEKEISENEEKKKIFEQEMLEILKKYGSIDNIDPSVALDDINDNMNICQSKNFFNYLKQVVRDFTIEGNKLKISKKLSDIGLAYKAKEEYDIKNKYVTIDSNRICDCCKKKIGSITFVVYPNLKVYHSNCAPNIHIDPKTGVDFRTINSIG